MPIFEYACKGCGKEFEALTQGNARTVCPICAGTELKKKMSTFAVSGNGAVFSDRESMGPCGTCGDPRGASACAMN